jgi:hypothetical protein
MGFYLLDVMKGKKVTRPVNWTPGSLLLHLLYGGTLAYAVQICQKPYGKGWRMSSTQKPAQRRYVAIMQLAGYG